MKVEDVHALRAAARKLAVACETLSRPGARKDATEELCNLLHQLEQPEPEPQDQEAAVALHTVHLDELTEQLAELVRRVDKIHETPPAGNSMICRKLNEHSEQIADCKRATNGLAAVTEEVDKHLRTKIAALAERVNLQQGQIKGVVCRDDDFHDRFKTIEGRLEELTKLVDDHHSTTEGSLDIHWGELTALGAHYHATGASAGRSGPPICVDRAPATHEASPAPVACEHPKEGLTKIGYSAQAAVFWCSPCGAWYREDDGRPHWQFPECSTAPPKPACEHPNVTVRSVVLRSGCAQTEVCDKCHAIYADGWHIPQPTREPPKPACEHREMDVELHGMGDHSIGIRTCQNHNCQAIWVGGRWYTAGPSSETPPASPEPACEHPKTRVLIRDRLDDIAVMECESCKDILVRGAWYSPAPPSETGEGDEADEGSCNES